MGGSRILAVCLLATLCLAQENELFDAARRGDLAKLKPLAAIQANVNLRDAHGRTALHEAAANCQMDAYNLLIQSGWDFFARDDQGTPARDAGGQLSGQERQNRVSLAYSGIERAGGGNRKSSMVAAICGRP